MRRMVVKAAQEVYLHKHRLHGLLRHLRRVELLYGHVVLCFLPERFVYLRKGSPPNLLPHNERPERRPYHVPLPLGSLRLPEALHTLVAGLVAPRGLGV